MFCPKCGEKNMEGAKFCSKCGEALKESKKTTTKPKEVPSNPENVVGTIFTHMIAGFIKPFTSFDKNKEKLSTTKYSLIYAGFVSGIMWILSIISTIFTAARKINYGSFINSITFDFSPSNVNYVKIIFVNLFVYVGLVAAIAGILTLCCLIGKKKLTFFKSLAITSTAIVPYALTCVFLAPLFGMLHVHIQGIIAIAGLVYSFLIFFGLVNDEISFKSKEAKFLFYFACIGSLCLVFYFVYYYFGSMDVNKSLLERAYDYYGRY